jgi:hypothetical protein
MEHPCGVTVRTRVHRRFSFVALGLALALGATACSGSLVGQADAATVGDATITRAQLDERIAQYRDLLGSFEGAEQDPQVAAILEQLGGNQYRLDADAVALELSELINQEIVAQAVDRLDAEITDEQREQAREQLATAIETRGATIDELPETIIESYVEQRAGQVAIQAAVPEELRTNLDEANADYEALLRRVYDENPDAFGRVCGYLFATAEEAAATDAVRRIEGGEPFADVAAEVSTIDPASATQIQCYDDIAISEIFSEPLVAGALLGPVLDSEQWVVLQVESLERAPFEEVRAQIEENVVSSNLVDDAQAAITEYLTELFRDIAEEVSVDPRFGTWNPEALQVVSNAPVAPTTVPVQAPQTPQTVPSGP